MTGMNYPIVPPRPAEKVPPEGRHEECGYPHCKCALLGLCQKATAKTAEPAVAVPSPQD